MARDRLTAMLDGGDHRIQNVWVAYGDRGYRVSLPTDLAAHLVRAVNSAPDEDASEHG